MPPVGERSESPRPRFFASATAFRRWLERHHASTRELWVGFWKASSGKGGLSYDEAVEEALCFGWIDGLVKRIDDRSYRQRFTPRKPGGTWSTINLAKVERLERAGRMAPAGLAAVRSRDPAKTGLYSFENRDIALAPGFARRMRGPAWDFLQAQPPGWRRTAIFWVMSAKKPETREKRFAELLAACAAGKRLDRI